MAIIGGAISGTEQVLAICLTKHTICVLNLRPGRGRISNTLAIKPLPLLDQPLISHMLFVQVVFAKADLFLSSDQFVLLILH